MQRLEQGPPKGGKGWKLTPVSTTPNIYEAQKDNTQAIAKYFKSDYKTEIADVNSSSIKLAFPCYAIIMEKLMDLYRTC
jgi:hypothetical protein